MEDMAKKPWYNCLAILQKDGKCFDKTLVQKAAAEIEGGEKG